MKKITQEDVDKAWGKVWKAQAVHTHGGSYDKKNVLCITNPHVHTHWGSQDEESSPLMWEQMRTSSNQAPWWGQLKPILQVRILPFALEG